ALHRLFNPATKSNMAVKLYTIKGASSYHTGQTTDPSTIGVRAVNKLTLEIELEAPSLYFLYLLAEPIAFPIPKHITNNDWHNPESFVGNGAYILNQHPVPNKPPADLGLSINPFYRKSHPKQLTQIELDRIEPSVENYAKNKVDWCRVEKLSDFNDDTLPGTKMLIQGFVTYFLAYSCHQPPFNDPAIRQAFAMAIDKEALIQDCWSGMPKPARGGMLPPGMPGHSPEIGLRFAPDKAREMIANFGKEKLKDIKLVSITGFGETPEFLQKSWSTQLGIDVSIQKDAPIGESLQAIKTGDVQMLLLGISMGNPGPENILALVKGQSPLNYWGWRDEAYDRLLAQTLASSDITAALNNYHDLDQIVVQESAVLIPLYYQQAYGMVRDGFRFSNTVARVRDQRLNFKNLRLS
ncbi:MAG: ABC transporter substrate-binding protein, partial [Chloroflexota bacterium]